MDVNLAVFARDLLAGIFRAGKRFLLDTKGYQNFAPEGSKSSFPVTRS